MPSQKLMGSRRGKAAIRKTGGSLPAGSRQQFRRVPSIYHDFLKTKSPSG